MRVKWMRSFRVPFVVLACAAGSYAQSVMGFGAITGNVTDAYGEGMPDATVTVINKSFGINRSIHTTDDGLFTLQKVACLGCCSLSPVVMINEETYGRLTPKKVQQLLKEYRGRSQGEAE